MKAKKNKNTKWDDSFYFRAYQWARDGVCNADIAKRLGTTPGNFYHWVETKAALAKALAEARKSPKQKHRDGYLTFREFAYERLPDKARKLWDTLEAIDKEAQKPDHMLERNRHLDLISAQGLRIRQHLFLYALIHSNFMHTAACRKVGISNANLTHWMETDSDFRQLVDGVHDMKKDFFESSLINLVRQGDSAATIFVNRTLNRDRGYSDKITVETTGSVEHRHKHEVSLDDLSPQAVREILEARRRRQAQLEDKRDVQDAEVVE